MRKQPQDIDSEMAVIGAILLDPEACDTASEQLTAGDFFEERHRLIFDAVRLLRATDRPVDLITVTGQLKADGSLSRAGGAQYLAELIDYVPTSANIAYYSGRVRKSSLARNTIEAARAIATAACDENADLDEIISSGINRLENVTSGHVSTDPFQTINALADKYQHYVRTIEKLRFTTGFPEIDSVIRGVGPKEVMYILGGPGLFKSALLQNIFIGACGRTDKWYPYFSLEMSDIRMFERTVQIGMGHFTYNIESGFHHHQGYRENVLSALSSKGVDRLLICDHGGLTIDQIEHYTRLARRKYGEIGAIGIDLLGLTTAPGASGLFELIETNAPAIMNMAKRLDVPVIVLAHTKRPQAGLQQGAEMTMEAGKGSGAIEQYARFMIGLWRDKDKNIICSVLKNTNGEAGLKFTADMNPAFLQFKGFTPYDSVAAKYTEGKQSRIRGRYTQAPAENDPY